MAAGHHARLMAGHPLSLLDLNAQAATTSHTAIKMNAHQYEVIMLNASLERPLQEPGGYEKDNGFESRNWSIMRCRQDD